MMSFRRQTWEYCLTRGNLTAPWLLFEAGALAKHLAVARVIPYLFRLKADDIAPPLSQFQSVGDDETGTRRLLQTINDVSATPLRDEQLTNAFRAFWPRFNRRLSNIALLLLTYSGACKHAYSYYADPDCTFWSMGAGHHYQH